MKYSISQSVKIVDMNDEIMAEVLFDHGDFELSALAVGSSVITNELGLRQFDVVYDRREGKKQRIRIVDIEIDLITQPATTRVYLEPRTLIIGQHDVGEV
ncbi:MULTISPECIES: hypothetical protein [Paenibacillus]|uniref:DUF2283 domain-containing protein n=1 Tax=Paenibacillus baimaensis TaxID=2982185 RepID=A0ABT2UPD2_9BACL|nr:MULTISPECIES: hypothetical protein [unclassified Paenibacillus]MCU6796505.1 hypothetical protein [Paenibacillus sp. WQ 127069]OMF14021.1 hypothetical protein BK127_18975 [Paenibacillus sp. FSL H7-0331]